MAIHITDPKLIERIARAMCKASRRDPDTKIIMGGEPALANPAGCVRAYIAPDPSVFEPMWHLFSAFAETAILELEAAAMEPFPLSPGTNSSEAPEVPVERTPWYPLLRPENKALYERRRDLDEMKAAYSAVAYIPSRIHDADIRGELGAAGFAEFLNGGEAERQAPKDAPLREAIRRAQEKRCF